MAETRILRGDSSLFGEAPEWFMDATRLNSLMVTCVRGGGGERGRGEGCRADGKKCSDYSS